MKLMNVVIHNRQILFFRLFVEFYYKGYIVETELVILTGINMINFPENKTDLMIGFITSIE
jgi:hypothetical protein